jgi:hypothetical protein
MFTTDRLAFSRAASTGEQMKLRDYLEERYSLKRSISSKTEGGYLYAIQSLDRYVGRAVELAELNEKLVNSWLKAIAPAVSAVTLSFCRRHLMVLWRSAAEDELCPPPAMWRVRKVKCPPRVPLAWSIDEVRLLAHSAKRLEGDYEKLGVRRNFFWQVAIRCAWDEGLRWGDLLNQPPGLFRRTSLRATMIQHKTGRPVLVGIDESTWTFLAAVPHWPRLLHWPYCQRYFSTEFAEVVKLAGLKGPWIKLRKSSGSDVEKRHPGWGSMHLGHSLGPRISTAFYFDPRITQVNKPMPEPL